MILDPLNWPLNVGNVGKKDELNQGNISGKTADCLTQVFMS